MALSPKLDLRQSQSLVMTPMLMQSIRLLQLTHIELQHFIELEVEKNPLLERLDSTNDDFPDLEEPRGHEDLHLSSVGARDRSNDDGYDEGHDEPSGERAARQRPVALHRADRGAVHHRRPVVGRARATRRGCRAWRGRPRCDGGRQGGAALCRVWRDPRRRPGRRIARRAHLRRADRAGVLARVEKRSEIVLGQQAFDVDGRHREGGGTTTSYCAGFHSPGGLDNPSRRGIASGNHLDPP